MLGNFCQSFPFFFIQIIRIQLTLTLVFVVSWLISPPLDGGECFKKKVGTTFWKGYMIYTLSPIIMEVENGGLEDDFSLQGGRFPLPWLWEEEYVLRQGNCSVFQKYLGIKSFWEGFSPKIGTWDASI